MICASIELFLSGLSNQLALPNSGLHLLLLLILKNGSNCSDNHQRNDSVEVVDRMSC